MSKQRGDARLIKTYGAPVREPQTGRTGTVATIYNDHAVGVRWAGRKKPQRVSVAGLELDREAIATATRDLGRSGGLGGTLAWLCGRLDAFDAACERNQHTDTGAAWELFHTLRAELGRLYTLAEFSRRELGRGASLGDDAVTYALLQVPGNLRLQPYQRTPESG